VLGTWRGSAFFRGARLDLSVRFERDGGALRATMSSPDLLLLDQPLDSVQSAGNSVRFVTHDDHPLRFEGDVDGDSLRGTAVPPAVPGVLDPGPSTPRVRFALGRVSPPASPPYATRGVRIASGGIRLAGTLFVPPPDSKRHAGIVILQGSSTNQRREYEFYADHFARVGLVVLTFDKRGNGESTGDYSAATYDALADDAAAAVEFLRARPEADPRRVGVWGLSQGAFIAPLVAARVPALDFIVAVSAPGMPIGETAAYQDSVRLVSSGFDASVVLQTVSLDRRLLEWLRTGRASNELDALLVESAAAPWRRASSLPARLPSGSALEGWYWRGRTFDPAPAWRAVRVPVLAVYGAADELVPARSSARLVENALHRGGNRDVTVRVFPAANHVIRTLPLVAGGRWDWPRAASGYTDLVTAWVLEHTR
jgi:alpha-beta hydrolase superfamily lysophospholipase